jgi:hypothetical protein
VPLFSAANGTLMTRIKRILADCVKKPYFCIPPDVVNDYIFMKNSILTIIAAVIIFTLSSCKQDSNTVTPETKAKTYYGESRPMGGDSIRSWIKTDLNGNPSSIGVSFSQSAFAKLAGDDDTTFMMMLPMMASGGMMNMMAAPFDHIEVDWSKNGDAMAPFNVAHFDMHCFAIDTMTQMGIMMGHDHMTMTMDTMYLPHGYELMMDAEAMMGVHAMDTTDHDTPFNHTCMYGFTQGNLAFVEPMVAKTYLDSKVNFSADIKQPTKFKKSGWYPTKYYIRYDGTAKEYSISIDNFVMH